MTFEFENVPIDAVDAIEALAPVRPSGAALHTAQQRAREKAFLADRGFPTAPFARAADARRTVGRASRASARPPSSRPRRSATTARGSTRSRRRPTSSTSGRRIGHQEAVVEKFIVLQAEISVIAARGLDGAIAEYPPFENRHRNHILDVTTAPAAVPPAMAPRAAEIARAILEELQYVGVLCVEFFVSTDGELLVNELAPRPHNSGHLTFDAAVTSQFEQQVRAICGLPLGSTELLQPAAMANLLGDLWADGEPNWAAALPLPGREAAPLRQERAASRPEDGPPHRDRRTVAEAQDSVVAARDALLS